uniref:ATP-binding protein n=1 Tax=Heterorhabditis bacteriophora TaxID=37862 RepID=A0A1I7WGC7_HETBA
MSNEFSDYSVKNYYTRRNNKSLFPNRLRGCIIGKSGCGKTNLLMNLLLDGNSEDYLDYNNLYIFSTTLFQPCYQALINGFENGLSKKKLEIVLFIRTSLLKKKRMRKQYYTRDKLNLDYIYRDHCSEIDKKEFHLMVQEIWNKKYSFLTIDKTSEKENGKFRKHLKYFYIFT